MFLGYLNFCVAMVLRHCHKINIMTMSVICLCWVVVGVQKSDAGDVGGTVDGREVSELLRDGRRGAARPRHVT